jgi:hypothetical protein
MTMIFFGRSASFFDAGRSHSVDGRYVAGLEGHLKYTADIGDIELKEHEMPVKNTDEVSCVDVLIARAQEYVG